MALPDLITTEYATAALAEQQLSAAQLAALPAAIAAASGAVRRWCGDRDFARATYDRTFAPTLDGRVFLDQLPVNAVARVSSGRAVALRISNSDRSTNQRATVAFTLAGDVDSGLSIVGLALTRTASGVATAATVDFTSLSPPTIAALASAVNALGGGWSASLGGSLGPWGVSELIADDAPAGGAFEGVSLDVWAADLAGCRLDRETGILDTGRASGAGVGRVRVAYDAGYDAIPAAVQQATALAASAFLADLKLDPRLSSETDGEYSYVANTAFADMHLPKAALGLLAPYRIHRA